MKGVNIHMTVQNLLLVVAIVCFVVAALGVAVSQVALVPLGLAFFAAAHLS